MIPYCEREEGGVLSRQQKKFNFLHSSTRMPVESTFGIWKGRFRMLQCVLSQETPRCAAQVVVATIVLHNLMTKYRDPANIALYVEAEDDDDFSFDDTVPITQREIGITKRNAISSLICS
ncbi:hypothetical protein JG688_00018236 [Phytophthora aleatoria]|uniref:DDE Tnp4 domain-containing protein n=1 Tax=Phytophthora aleatoria TaxID=2496075 RepID=A0A8J5MB91_9STRA|nr:hypothetical protein JG688_00018236 [Phytophthora aleatoria]